MKEREKKGHKALHKCCHGLGLRYLYVYERVCGCLYINIYYSFLNVIYIYIYIYIYILVLSND